MEEDNFFSSLFGGFLGSVLSKTRLYDKKTIQEYKKLENQIQIRKECLGTLPYIPNMNLYNNPEIYSLFREAYGMYLYGFPRPASVFAVATIEHTLRKRFPGEKILCKLIEKAEQNGILTRSERHYLDGLRMDRNEFIHELSQPVSEDDAQFTLRLTIKILKKLL